MELTWLEDFVAVATRRNFSQAARERHATQPALSRRVKALENWLGAALLDRSTHPLSLTAAGADLLSVAEKVISDLHKCRREIRAKAERSTHTIRFCMPHTLAGTFFPLWWSRQVDHQHLTRVVIAADFYECVNLLLDKSCHFLACFEHDSVPTGFEEIGISRIKIGQDKLVPVCKKDESGRPAFNLENRGNSPIPLLAYSADSFLGKVSARLYERLRENAGINLRFESTLVGALKTEAILGEGIAWLPYSMIQGEVEDGTLFVFEDEQLSALLDITLCRLGGNGALPNSMLSEFWKSIENGRNLDRDRDWEKT